MTMGNPSEATKKRQRTCISCGTQDQKKALHRIVRDAQGQVSFDATGRAAGRGAYVCSQECFESACKTGRLGRSLRCSLSVDDYETIASALASALREA